jgi:hypothetical protein
MDFSVVLASRERTYLLSSLVDSIYNHTSDISNVEVLIGIDDDDASYRDLTVTLPKTYPFIKFKSRQRSRKLNQDYLNWLACEHSSSKYVIICNDDVQFMTPGWDDIIREKMEAYLSDKPDRIAYGFVSDALINRHGMGYTCFPVLTREAITALEFAMPAEYPSWGADIAIWRVYSGIGRICDLSQVMLKHISYHAGTREVDHINQHVSEICGYPNAPIDQYIARLQAKMV